MSKFLTYVLFLFVYFATSNAVLNINVISFGAKPDGKTDSAAPFLQAWDTACDANEPAHIIIPKGTFFVTRGMYHGPCNNTKIKIYIHGAIVSRTIGDKTQTWLVFRYIDGLTIEGGVLDGRGSEVWACKAKSGADKCNFGATTLSINHCTNVVISGLTIINSQYFHMSIFASENVVVKKSKIFAPGDSPNTDGIHVGMSNRVKILVANIRTGDDCISLGPGSTNVHIDQISCGPGHGISIGSLAEVPKEAGVQNVTVKRAVLTGTTNGLRIKSYGRESNGFVDEIAFRHVVMRNVSFPIIIDQNYCSSKSNCPKNSSGVTISNVEFKNIRGSSATPVAIKLDCSPAHPCTGIRLSDVNLAYPNKTAISLCRFAHGSTTGVVKPTVPCL